MEPAVEQPFLKNETFCPSHTKEMENAQKHEENLRLENNLLLPHQTENVGTYSHKTQENTLPNNTNAILEPKRNKLPYDSSKPPACFIITLLGKKLQNDFQIGIHWLTTVQNLLSQPYTPEIAKVIATMQ